MASSVVSSSPAARARRWAITLLWGVGCGYAGCSPSLLRYTKKVLGQRSSNTFHTALANTSAGSIGLPARSVHPCAPAGRSMVLPWSAA